MNLLDPALSQPSFQWNERLARHLLNRAGFGVPPTAIAKLAAMKFPDAVASFVDFEKLPDVGPPVPADLPERMDYQELRMAAGKMTEDQKRQLRQEKQKEAREAMIKLQAWWVERMCKSQRPLQEKMTLFWHGHFATSAEKVKEPESNLDLNQIFRNNATGNFRTLAREVGKSAAMLRYLDQQQSSKQKPNENWARELMELFTLGIGNYTEFDIKEAARAFTGWTNRNGQFQFVQQRHDTGIKNVLGVSGNLNGDQVIDIVFSQPACAEFICKKLWTYFAYDNPEQEIVKGLADTLTRHNYELKPVLRQMFASHAFYQDKAIDTQVKSPAQLVVNLIVQLGTNLPAQPPITQLAMRAMGQSLFYPPNVKGWDGGRAWINTNSLLIRYNFSNYLVSGVAPSFNGRGAKKVEKTVGDRRRFLQRNGNKDEAMQMDMEGEGMQSMSESGGMREDNDDPRQGPAGQDAMAKDIPSSTLYSALTERRAEKFESRMMERAPFRVRDFFKRFDGKTSDEIITALTNYFVGFPLEAAQQDKLKDVMAQAVPDGKPVPVTKIAEEDLRATVQLMLSTVEYQVC
jgi:uncharacterized protein (DUF1800 family)